MPERGDTVQSQRRPLVSAVATERPSQSSSSTPDPEEKINVTFRFARRLAKVLKVYSAVTDVSQNDVAETALIRYLTDQGVDCNHSPVITSKHKAAVSRRHRS